MSRSSRTRARSGLLDLGGRVALLGGIACAVLVTRSPWWAIGAVLLLPAGVWLTVAQLRAWRDAQGEEALEAAEEYDRTHPDEATDRPE